MNAVDPVANIQSRKQARLLFRLLIGASACAAGLLAAARAEENLSTSATQDLKELTDPTILRTRVWLESEWNEFARGSDDGKLTLGAVYAWRISPQQDWAVRLKVPVAWHEAGDVLGDTDEVGSDDVELATGTAFRLNKAWRTGGGLELHADTASNDAVGDGVWRLKPFWSVACDATRWLTLTFTAEYHESLAAQTGIGPQRYCELLAPVAILLSDHWSLSAQYKAKCDFEDGDRWTQAVKAGVSMRLSSAPVAFSASMEKPLGGGEKKFQANFGVTYFFGH
jgi:hypothetical protein